MSRLEYQPESGVPIPQLKYGANGGKYPWSELLVGDSFFVPHATIHRMSTLCSHRCERYEVKYTCRTVVESGVKGVRVWRTK